MAGPPSIRLLADDYGQYPGILPLNPSLRPGAPALRARLEIDWDPRDPYRPIAALEAGLLLLLPSLKLHECRGPAQYHVRRFSVEGEARPTGARADIEAAMVLAHLIEHAMIDAVAFITRERIVSGVTGALRDSSNQFDVFVECPDRRVASLAARLAISWVRTLVGGGRPRRSARPTLELARTLWRARPHALALPRVARDTGRSTEEARDILDELEALRFACREPSTLNFSGIERYRVCPNGRTDASRAPEDPPPPRPASADSQLPF